MKILISRKDLRDTTSGVPKKVLQELQFFKARGHESFAIAETINFPMIEESGGIPVKTLRWPFSGYFRRKFYHLQVDRWIRKHHPGVVIGHGDILHQDVLFIHNCVHLANELVEKKPLPAHHEVGRIHEAIFRTGSFKLLICNSHLMKDDLARRFYVNPSIIRVIYPEVNLGRFIIENPEPVRQEWRTKFGFTDKDVVIGLVTSGNFRKRNLGLLIDAYKELARTYPRAKLFVAGGKVDQRYQEQAEGAGVVFAPAIIDVKYYFNLLDIFVLPAHLEEFGRSVLEAMFLRKPVITSKFVGASEILTGDSRQLILDKTTLMELVRVLVRLLESSSLRDELGKCNHEIAVNYSADEQNKHFAAALDEFGIFRG